MPAVARHRQGDVIAALLERREQALGAVDRDGEADANVALDRAVDGIVDADQLTATVQERTAGIPRIDRRVGLNHSGQLAPARRLAGPVQAGDDARGEGALQAEW